MRLILIFCLFIPLVGFSQEQKPIKSDTTYLYQAPAPEDWPTDEDTIWYMKREITYKDNTGDAPFRPLGDSATAFNFYKNISIDEGRQIGQAAAIAIERQQVVRAVRTRDKALTAMGLGDLRAGIDSIVWKEYLNHLNPPNYIQDYDVMEGNTPFLGQIRRLNNGNYRLTFNSVNRRIIFYAENWVRIQDYPTNGLFIDLFRISQREWVSIGGINDGTKTVPTLSIKRKQ